MNRLAYMILLFQLVSNVYASENANTTSGNDAEVNTIIEPNSTSGGNSLTQFGVFKEGRRPDPIYRASQMAFVGSILADIGTTWNLPKGYTEGNPLLGKRKGQQVAVSGGLCFLALWEAHTLKIHGHAGTAKYFLWLGTALHGFAGLHNALQ